MRIAWIAGLLAVGLIVSSCGGGGEGPAFVYGTDAGIVEQPLEGDPRVLVAPAARQTLGDPALSPDGTQLVYTSAYSPRSTGGVLDAASEVRIAKADGSESRTLYGRSVPGEVASSPRWLDDTTVLFLTRKFIDPADPPRGSVYSLVRIDTQNSALTPVADGAFQFNISPDGTRIAYLKVASATVQPLYIANPDGSDAQLRLDTASSGLGGFAAVAFSSDGASLFLTAHPEQGASSRTSLVSLNAFTHGAPVDLYTLPIDAGDPVLVAPLQVLGGTIAVGSENTVYVTAEKLLQIDTATGTHSELEDVVGPFRGLFYAE